VIGLYCPRDRDAFSRARWLSPLFPEAQILGERRRGGPSPTDGRGKSTEERQSQPWMRSWAASGTLEALLTIWPTMCWLVNRRRCSASCSPRGRCARWMGRFAIFAGIEGTRATLSPIPRGWAVFVSLATTYTASPAVPRLLASATERDSDQKQVLHPGPAPISEQAGHPEETVYHLLEAATIPRPPGYRGDWPDPCEAGAVR